MIVDDEDIDVGLVATDELRADEVLLEDVEDVAVDVAEKVVVD